MKKLWLRRLGLDRGRAHAAKLEQQVTALQTALARCKGVAQRARAQRALMPLGAVLFLVLGLAFGAYSEAIKQSVTDRVPGFASTAANPDAAYAAYDEGDHAAALRLARPMAEQGDVRAQSLLGSMYYIGRGVVRDDAEAVKWSRLAADQGDAEARFRLGLMYSQGRGVPQDHAEAAGWFRLAAAARQPEALYNLGVLHATGEGVTRDNIRAYMWFNLAVEHFPPSDTRNRSAAIRSRDIEARKLSREEIAEAERLTREWQSVARAQHAGGTS
jgi:TPR repeat protein